MGGPPLRPVRRRVPVIGIVGGIGSGKSEVARVLARLGCVVTDSDALAREIIQRPQVRDELVLWWGSRVLDAHGQVDRARVAEIVFADAAERSRLEGLIHPLIHAERARVIARAARDVPPPAAVVVDAPLLFEAGVDRECDAVVFVDTPIEKRLERVRERGWDEEELHRRERSQMPLEEKRRRSGYVVNNDGGLADLEEAVRRVLRQILGSRG